MKIRVEPYSTKGGEEKMSDKAMLRRLLVGVWRGELFRREEELTLLEIARIRSDILAQALRSLKTQGQGVNVPDVVDEIWEIRDECFATTS